MTSTSNHGHNSGGQYDQSLLAEAPKASKQMRQEGYNPDILNRNGVENGNRDLESGLGASKERLALGAHGTSTPRPTLTPTPRSPPFYRTKKGVIIIVVATLVVIGAVIGGAVGGTRNRHHEDTAKAAGSAPGDGTSGSNTGKAGSDGSSGSGIGVPGDPPQGHPGGGGREGGGISSNSTSVQNPLGAITSALDPHSSSTTTSLRGPPTAVHGVGSVPDSIVQMVGAPPL